MSFDSKRGKVFKWLDELAGNVNPYAKDTYNDVNQILTVFGRLYATNGIVVASVEYPEFEHLSDEKWMAIAEYKDENGYYLETPVLEEPLRNYREKFLEEFFIGNVFVPNGNFKFDTRVMKHAMKPFEIYRLKPNLIVSENKCEFTAHDADISVKVMFMGVGYNER